MANDPFSDAGERLRRDFVRDEARRDQAISALTDLASFCEEAIGRFYRGEQNDVFVEQPANGQLQIRYGLRPGKFDQILNGPFATVFATPDGRLLWGETRGWVASLTPEQDMPGREVDLADLELSVTPLLVAFLQSAEEQYRQVTA